MGLLLRATRIKTELWLLRPVDEMTFNEKHVKMKKFALKSYRTN